MEEFQQSQDTSANNVDVAAPQTEPQAQEPSANNSDVANQNPVQDADTNARYADMRRKQELDQYRSQAETYQQQLDRTARIAGYQSHDELIAALDQIEQQQQQQQQQELYENAIAGDPNALNDLISNHPAVQYAMQLQTKQQQDQQFQQEANELFQEFPDLKPEEIPNEVWQLKEQRGLSMLDAYLRVNYKNLAQQQEQAAIQKLQQNQLSSPGALGAGADHITSYSQLSAQDKAALRQRVLRGESINL
jgi:hypothetical protein